MFFPVNILTNWINLPFRCVVLFLILTTLANCSYSQKSEKVDSFINYGSLKDVNKHGNFKASLRKETHLSGNAQLIGQYCSAHKYPYNFDIIIDDAVTTVLDKVYQTVALEIITSDDDAENDNHFNIHVDPVNVRLMCHPITEYNWECVATTKLTGSVIDIEDKKIDIAVEKRQASSAGGACGGGADAISASIGQAIDGFSTQLYDILILN